MFRKFVPAFLIFSFFLSVSFVYADSDVSIINIESAETTEYRKDKDTGTEEIVLSGSVSISVTKGSTKTVITAASITYNRKTDMLFAQGNVTLKQTGSSAGEQNITADTLLFNTSTLEGIFDQGRVVQVQSDAINLPSGSTLIVASDIFGRDSSNTIAFENANLTFCDDENPHWKIKASRIWLLPGGEFAFFNALLSVGNIPLVYLPAFYYPKDELIFNPSFGYDKRLGYYFQTTTYITGRKPLDTSSSSTDDEDITKGLFNFMKSSTLKEQRREGLVLHNLEEDYKGSTSNYLKVLGDFYTNLGYLAGVEGVFKPKKYISSLDASVLLGFSRTIYETGGGYTPFDNSSDAYWDKSNFMGFELPFRYSGNLKMSMTKPFSLSVDLPIYSDPYFKGDFGERSEYIDWLGFIMSGQEKEEEKTTSSVSSFTWNINGSYTVPLPAAVKPYISALSFSSVGSSVTFSSKTNNSTSSHDWSSSYSPERSFFYPSQVIPFKASARLSGTLVQYPSTSSSSAAKNKAVLPVELDKPEELMTAEEKDKAALEKSDEKSENKEKNENKTENEQIENETDKIQTREELVEELFPQSELSLLNIPSVPSLTKISGWTYDLTYSVTPSITSQLNYNSSEVSSPEDFDWKNLYSTYYQVKAPVNLNSKVSYGGSLVSMNNSFDFNPVFQDHPNLDGYTSESSIESVKKSDYNAKKLDLSNSNSISVKPFAYTKYFKNTSIDWRNTMKLVRTEFLGDAEHPEWDYNSFGDGELKDTITAHSLSGTISANEGKFSQSLTLTTMLPPQVEEYSGTMSFVFPYVNLSFATGIRQKSADDETFVKQPFKQNATLKFFNNNLSLSESFNYNLEDDNADSLKLSLNWKTLQLAYTMSYTTGYKASYDEQGQFDNWIAESEKEFQPYSFSLSYSLPSKTHYLWLNRITFAPSFSSSIVYDCLRPTNSYLRFAPTVAFKIYELFDLSFTLESQNNVIFRYFQDYAGYENTVGGEKNIFVDLWNSFVFWEGDQEKRKSSGFKMKNLKISLTHQLCDWNLAANLTFKPRVVDKQYDYQPYFSLSVSWRPMASMKTEIVDEYGKWSLN